MATTLKSEGAKQRWKTLIQSLLSVLATCMVLIPLLAGMTMIPALGAIGIDTMPVVASPVSHDEKCLSPRPELKVPHWVVDEICNAKHPVRATIFRAAPDVAFLKLFDADGMTIGVLVLKIDPYTTVASKFMRYKSFVSGRDTENDSEI